MNPLDTQRRLRALTVRNEAPEPTVEGPVATIRLYDAIDSWGDMFGVSAKEFTRTIDALPDDVAEIRLLINSPGGDVFDGLAILNALRNHPARVVAVVEGLAASAASFVACGADELIMARNSELMIHDAWGLCVGNAADMNQMAEMLDHLSDNIASVYADKSGGTPGDWREAMAKETWYSAEEAVAAGLADRVDAKKPAAKAAFDLSIFTYAGRDAAPAPVAEADLPAGDLVTMWVNGTPVETAAATNTTNTFSVTFNEPQAADVTPVASGDTPEANSDDDATGATEQDAEDLELRARALQLIAATR